jgi:DNA-binding NtrC family response regulator
LREYEWPGNVRQLINAIERAVLLCSEDRITMEDLPRSVVNATVGGTAEHGSAAPAPAGAMITALLDKPLTEARAQLVGEFERSYLSRLLEDTGGRISATADRAGINQRHLYDLMRRHSLSKESFKKQSRR